MTNESFGQTLQKKLRSKVVLLAGLVLLLFFSINFIRSRGSSRGVDQEINNLKDETGELERNNAQLAELIKYLNSPAYLEEKARTDLGLRRAGEEAVIVPDARVRVLAGPDQPTTTTAPSTSNPRRWWRYFFAKK